MRWLDRSSIRIGLAAGGFVGGVLILVGFLTDSPGWGWTGAAAAVGIYLLFTWGHYRRKALLREPFPEAWRAVLERAVPLHGRLEPGRRREFEQGIQVFLDQVRFHPVDGARLDDEAKVLVAAAAVMLVFQRPGFDVPPVRHLVIRPKVFEEPESGEQVQGVVTHKTSGALSLEDLRHGFRSARDGQNVTLHEIAHTLDLADGAADGVPAFLNPDLVRPWSERIREEVERNRKGDGALVPYAGTNEAEFFACAVEMFFERPDLLEKRHPELCRLFEGYFGKVSDVVPIHLKPLLGPRHDPGRNDPCPCGSGKKFKKCCLEKTG
jgi:hypothetical protein